MLKYRLTGRQLNCQAEEEVILELANKLNADLRESNKKISDSQEKLFAQLQRVRGAISGLEGQVNATWDPSLMEDPSRGPHEILEALEPIYKTVEVCQLDVIVH